MFGFLKDKLKSAISKFTKKVEDVSEIENISDDAQKSTISDKPIEEEKPIEETKPKLEKTKEPEQTEEKETPVEEVKEEPEEQAPSETKEELKEETEELEPSEEKDETVEEVIDNLEEEKQIEAEDELSEEKPETLEEKELDILKEEKEIIKEEIKLEEPVKEEQTETEKEVSEAVKEIEEKKLEEERIELEKEVEEIEEKKGGKSFFGFFKGKEETKKQEEIKEPEIKEEVKKPSEEVSEMKNISDDAQKSTISDKSKGIFSKLVEGITTKKITKEKFNELFWDLELALLENNVAVEVIEKIKKDLSENLVDKNLQRTKIFEIIASTLKKSIKGILEVDNINLLDKVKSKTPYIICFVGINGSGKTTTIAKVANMLKKNNLSCVLAASDTFRAAAIDQLQHHADKLDVKIIKQDYGADPAAVAFDAIKHAESKKIDVVLIDTAGRMHSNQNLLDEMKKIIRVAKPDLKIFIGESITGNDCVEQAQQFNEAINIDGIILSKADVDEKGGAALSISYVTKKPIMYIGLGQEYDDLKEFNSSIVLDNLGL